MYFDFVDDMPVDLLDLSNIHITLYYILILCLIHFFFISVFFYYFHLFRKFKLFII